MIFIYLFIFGSISDRFGPDDSADNSSTAHNSQPGKGPMGNAPPGNAQSGPFGNAQFPGASPFGNAQFPGNVPFGSAPNYPNAPVYTGGHFTSVSGHYDPNTQQTVIYQNINQKLK